MRLGKYAGDGGGWKGDLPLREDYPDEIEVDATALGHVVPVFLLRLATFIRWHVAQGRAVTLKWPDDPFVGAHLGRMKLVDCLPPESVQGYDGHEPPADDVVLPITQISKPTEIDALADPLLDVITGHAGTVAALGPAFHMAASELCGNAVEHGANPTGAFVAAQRYEAPRRLSLAIADLGVGIPEHVRQQFPEWHDDAGAIANATRERISGTGSSERGFGFSEIFREALTTAMNAAEMNIRSCRGQVRISVADGHVTPHGWATPYKRGSWIGYELLAAG